MTQLLPGLLLPLEGHTLLLPSSAIAEIIPYEKPNPIPDIPKWFMGVLTWRAIHIPLIILEKVESTVDWGEDKTPPVLTDKTHIAIINRDSKIQGEGQNSASTKYPFFSILLKNVPKMCRLTESTLKLVTKTTDDPRFLMEVKIQDDYVYIPNLPNLWKLIDALPSRLQWFRQVII